MSHNKTLTPTQREVIVNEVKALLHASRDCLRNRGEYDTRVVPYSRNDPYYAEAFGVMRALKVLGYGDYGAINIAHERNLSYWFSNLTDEVLKEENFGSSGECDHCLNKYGKDDVRKRVYMSGAIIPREQAKKS